MSTRLPGDRASAPATADADILCAINEAGDRAYAAQRGLPLWLWEHYDLGDWTAETVAPHRAAGCELTAPCKLGAPAGRRVSVQG